MFENGWLPCIVVQNFCSGQNFSSSRSRKERSNPFHVARKNIDPGATLHYGHVASKIFIPELSAWVFEWITLPEDKHCNDVHYARSNVVSELYWPTLLLGKHVHEVLHFILGSTKQKEFAKEVINEEVYYVKN